MTFLFSDTQIIDESFVEDINNMLNSGEVPNIFPNDERVAICEVNYNSLSYAPPLVLLVIISIAMRKFLRWRLNL